MNQSIIIISILIFFSALQAQDDSLNTRLLGHLDTPGLAYGIDVSGEYAFIANNDAGGLRIINISDLRSPIEVSYIDTVGYVWDVKISGNYAFIVTLNAGLPPGLKIIDISNPLMPELISFLPTPNSAMGLAIRENYIYVAYAGGLLIVDVANLNNPIQIGSINLNADARDVVLKDIYAFVVTLNNGLKIIDISNPSTPMEVASLNTAAYAQGLDIYDNFLYVAAVVLQIVDVADPLNPQIVGTLNVPNSPSDVSIENDSDFAYVVADGRGLRVIDVSDKSNPYEIGYYTSAGGLGIVSSGNTSFIAGGDQGLFIVQTLPILLQPNGGELWDMGNTKQIQWKQVGYQSFRIQYSTNDGNDWINIKDIYPADSSMFSWLIPNTPSPNCRVKINASNDSDAFDISDDVFIIKPISLLKPNGGEVWQVGSNVQIEWISVDIELRELNYSTNNGQDWIFQIVQPVPGIQGNVTWTVPNTPSDDCLVQIVNHSNTSVYDISDSTFFIENTSSIDISHKGQFDEFVLYQNIPNPFNPTTNIKFQIAYRGFVSLKVYDILGNEVATLVNEELEAGKYNVEFNSHSGEVRNLTSGIYFYRLQSGSFSETKKMLLLK